jgi:hypothetical protein
MSVPSPDSVATPPVAAPPATPRRGIDKAKLLVTLTGAAARGVANAVGMGIAGLALNLVLLAVCWRALGRLIAEITLLEPGSRSG